MNEHTEESDPRVFVGIVGRVRGERKKVLFKSDWTEELLIWCIDDLITCTPMPACWELADPEAGFYVIALT